MDVSISGRWDRGERQREITHKVTVMQRHTHIHARIQNKHTHKHRKTHSHKSNTEVNVLLVLCLSPKLDDDFWREGNNWNKVVICILKPEQPKLTLVQYEAMAPSESFLSGLSVKDEQLIRVSHAATATPFLMVIFVLCQRNDKGEKCKIWMSTGTGKEEGLNRAQNENVATGRSYGIKKDPLIVVFSG